MVVGGNRCEPAVPSGLNRLLEPPERKPLASELHQRQMDPEIHRSMVSDSVRGWPCSPLLLVAHCDTPVRVADTAPVRRLRKWGP